MSHNAKFSLKGNYFDNEFHIVYDKCDKIIDRYCPADTELLLWEAPVYNNHLEGVVQSADKGFMNWKSSDLQEKINYLKRQKNIK